MKKFKLDLKKKKSQKTATPSLEPEELFDDDAGLFEITPDEVPEKKRTINVKLEYDLATISVEHISTLIMECIEVRGLKMLKDLDMEKAMSICKAHGMTSAKVLSCAEDYWYAYIYSREYVRLHGTKEQKDFADYSILSRPNPEWDETKENVKQDGRTLGGVDDGGMPPLIPVEGDYGLGHVEGLFDIEESVPIKEQMTQKQKETIDKARPHSAPAEKDADRKDGERPDIRIWEMAQELAKKDRSEWEGKVDKMLELRAKYCYKWLQEFGTDAPSPAIVDLFWTKDVFSSDMSKDKLTRKQEITSQVMRYLQKAVAKKGDTVDMSLNSYRTVLAAMYLDTAINKYLIAGTKHKMVDDGSGGTVSVIDDTAELAEVKAAAKQYFKSHRPITQVGSPPGPISTLDPEYPDYLRICRQYKLPVGTMLHEVKL